MTKSNSAMPFKPGELVMHATHGLGRFSGMRAMGDADGQYLQLDYASGDRVFVPLEHLERVTKYVGDEVDVARLTSKESHGSALPPVQRHSGVQRHGSIEGRACIRI